MAESSTEQKDAFINFQAQKFVQVCIPELMRRKHNTTDLMVLLAVVRHFPTLEGGGWAREGWVGYSQIADESLCGERTVFDAVKRLEQSKALSKAGRRKSGENYYTLNLTDQHYQEGLAWFAERAKQKAEESSLRQLRVVADTAPAATASAPCGNCESPLADTAVGGAATASAPCGSRTQEEITETREEMGEETSQIQRVVGAISEPSVPVKQDKKKPAEPFVPQTVNASLYMLPERHAKPSKPAQPSKPTPEQQAAQHLFELLGEPKRHKEAVKSSWPNVLKPLFATRDLNTVKLGMSWAVEESNFWLEWLNKSGNPAAYTVEKFESWMSRRADDAEAATRKPKPQTGKCSSAATPEPKPSGLFKSFEPTNDIPMKTSSPFKGFEA